MLAAEEAKESEALWLGRFTSWKNMQEQQQDYDTGAGQHHGRWNLGPEEG